MRNNTITYEQKENRLDALIPRWFVIYTKFKTEKYVVEKLNKKGITAYVPLISYSKKYQRKVKHYEVPLINCYVFVKIVKEDYLKVLQTEYVSGFLKNRGNLNEVRDEELEILKRIVGEKNNVKGENLDYYPGKPVEIISGNLTGIKGRLIDKQGKTEFLVELETIGWQLRMLIDKENLRGC